MLSLHLLHRETKNRKLSTALFTTKYLKLFSISCIFSGFIFAITMLLSHIKGLCVFIQSIAMITMVIQFLSMGSYQLSRVYYCFANEQIHSSKGYPRWLFITMYIAGVLLSINFLVSNIFLAPPYLFVYDCGFDDNLQFYYYPIKFIHDDQSRILSWFIIACISCLSWDLFTLFMYIYKIRAFRRYRNDLETTSRIVYKRIMNNLNKIAILTSFYHITCTIVLVIAVIFAIIFENELVPRSHKVIAICCESLSISYSMYLMMDHNKKQYVTFLKYIYRMRLYWLCCCCGHMVVDQFNDLRLEDEMQITEDQKMESTNWETTDISNDDYKIKTNGNELSIDTTIAAGVDAQIAGNILQ